MYQIRFNSETIYCVDYYAYKENDITVIAYFLTEESSDRDVEDGSILNVSNIHIKRMGE